MPSIQVRSRYIGDTNAPVGMRTSGTSASARNLIYADGILLSSLLGNNNTNTGSPRWNTVSPGEIERIDILYGPFSAAYAGNSIGGVINITTRMPEKFEVGRGRAGVLADVQSLRHEGYLREPDATTVTLVTATTICRSVLTTTILMPTVSRSPLRLRSSRARLRVAGDTSVTGAFPGANPTNAPNLTLGAGNINHTVQDNFKWKFAYDITSTIRLAYTLGTVAEQCSRKHAELSEGCNRKSGAKRSCQYWRPKVQLVACQ